MDPEYETARKAQRAISRPDGKTCVIYKTCRQCDGRVFQGEVNYRKKPCSRCGNRTAVMSVIVMDLKPKRKRKKK